jgi:hypothetical protein
MGEIFELVADPPRSVLSPWDQWRANETTGCYETEDDAKRDLMGHVNDDHWEVYQEVAGQVIHPKQDCHATKVTADYILWPKQSLISQGWSIGPVIVEVKKSGHKLGPLLSQAFDYMRCQFSPAPGVSVRPKFCVVFPLARVQETVQSIMSHERVGHSHIGEDGLLRIYLNGTLTYTQKGGIFLRHAMRSGRKFGSK